MPGYNELERKMWQVNPYLHVYGSLRVDKHCFMLKLPISYIG